MAFYSRLLFGNADSRIYSIMNDDHAALYRVVGELRDVIGRNCKTDDERAINHELCLEIVARLIAESVKHFQREEGLMKRYEYPLSRQHAMEHVVLLRTIESFQLSLRIDKNSFAADAVIYIKDWLTRHIGNADKHLQRFLMDCADKRTGKRKDLSTEGRHPLSFLWSVSDTVQPEVSAANRSFRAHLEVESDNRRHEREIGEMSRPNDVEQRRQQVSVWYE